VDDETALSLAKTETRFRERQNFLERTLGYHATAEGSAFYKECIPRLARLIRQELDEPDKTHVPRGLSLVLKRLKDPDLIAVSALTALMQSPGICQVEDCEYPRHETFERIGDAIHGECRARRKKVFTSARKKTAFASSVWSHEEICRAGGWLVDCVVQALPEVFRYDEDDMPEILPTAIDRAATIATKAMFRDPVLLACKRQPAPWRGFRTGGYWTEQTSLSAPFVRGCDHKTERDIRVAMADRSLRPHLDAVNSQQAVPWSIDERMLEVVKRFGPYHLARKPGQPKSRWRDGKRVYEPDDLFVFLGDLAAADRLSGEPFWVPMNVDWRGRFYGVPFFNYQRQDWVRSLFRFARGSPIGNDGIKWLSIYVATTGNFDGISKCSFDDRLEWIESNRSKIKEVAASPIDHYDWWSIAGRKKKFQFLSACIELSQALDIGPSFVSRLPVSFDATASGLQHLCAMSRADEGALVNLSPSEVPNDVYARIAGAVAERVRQHLFTAGELLTIGVEITRAVVKSCILTSTIAANGTRPGSLANFSTRKVFTRQQTTS
jgi:hypothetical protein